MSFNNGQMHGLALVGTFVLSGALFGGTLYMTEAAEPAHQPELKEMITIEASLARKSEKKKQPQKELKAPEPVAKPEGVSHDENKPPPPPPKKPEEKKPAKKPEQRDDKPIDIHKFKHASDDDPQPGAAPVTDIGQFDGSEKGFAPVNAGNPYWQNLAADNHQAWQIPTISKVNGTPVGCFHIEPDGKIADIKFDRPSGDPILDDSVQRALKTVQKARNDKPQPVPTDQLSVIKRWVCFRFDSNT
ncbi:MAG TPA: TonB C-terminal domain-containing protein [Kofleriaceae bacterium]|nr:TonB C-terminal domain-containing protein [Kofleriaceae bacterium]